jgi:uncharacterized delta-60 repeat protein
MRLSSLVGPRRAISGNKNLARWLGLALTLIGSDCLAATRTWTGGTPGDSSCSSFTNNPNWLIPCNWAGKTLPAAGDDLVFPASLLSISTNNFADGTAFNSLSISGGHIMSGAGIRLNAGISADNGLIQLSSITLNLDQTFTAPTDNRGALIVSPIFTNGKKLSVSGAGDFAFSGVINGSGSFEKTGSGTTQFLTNNTYTGVTNLFGGTTLIFGSQPQSSVSVGGFAGAFVGGTGVLGPLSIPFAGNIQPGPANGIGVLTVSSLGFGSDSEGSLRIDIRGTTPGTEYDQLKVGNAGAVNLGTGNFLSPDVRGFTPAFGDVFRVIDNTSTNPVLNTFSGLPEGAIFTKGGATFQITYQGGDGNDVVLTAVPTGTISFVSSPLSVNEDGGTASITLRRTGGGTTTTAAAAIALEDGTTTPADYLSPAGKLDTTLSNGTGVDGSIFVAALDANEKSLIGGSFNTEQNLPRHNVARLNANGSVDSQFDPGAGGDSAVLAIAVQPDGAILVGGTFANFGGSPRAGIARLFLFGALDSSFDPGTGVVGSVSAIALQPDGKILIGGQISSYNGVARSGIARLHPTGALDTTFDPGTGVGNAVVTAIALDSNGKILVAGSFPTFNGAARPFLVRLNSNGSIDSSFQSGTGPSQFVNALQVAPDGSILIGGGFSSYNGTARNRIARLNPNGSLDTTFDPGVGPDDVVDRMVLQKDGKPVIGGRFLNYNGAPHRRLVRLRTNGTLDPTYDPGTGPNGSVFTLALQPDGKVLVGGVFTQYNGVSRRDLVRVQGDLTATWGPNDFADKTVQLPIVNDSLIEGNEKLNLRIVPLRGAAAGAPPAAELTIVENDFPPAKALNIATRLRVETGDNVMIAGFIVTGNAPKPLVLRGMGPVLGNFGINDFLADPVLDLRGPGGPIVVNNNWKDTQRNQIEGTPFQPGDDREAVILATLPPASYTAILTGNNNTTGVGLIEVFDNDSATDSQLGNISTRGLVQGNDSVMIGGFILGGSTSNSRIAMRGIGPSLAQFGVNNVLADPTLELHDGNGATLISNDNWESDTTSAGQLSANGLALSDPKESGIFTTLPPGAFTAILAGKNGGTGIGLIEIFNLQ